MPREPKSDLVWVLPDSIDEAKIRQLSQRLGVTLEAAEVMWTRAHAIGRDPVSVFGDSSGDIDVSSLPLERASARLLQARESSEKVAIYSDFDADGVTSAVILKEALESLGIGSLTVYFPSRFEEGYGFHPDSVEKLFADGVSLFVTSDCGIAAHSGCSRAKELGCDVIVTDHHLPGEILPDAYEIVDPHLPGWKQHGLTDLTGAGVAYLLAKDVLLSAGLWGKMPERWATDLLTISIGGDGQPVLGLNRKIIRDGLALISSAPRPGIKALLEVAGLAKNGRTLSFDRDVTFGLVPRINAAGRLDSAYKAFALLSARDEDTCKELALELDGLNRKRREIEDAVVSEFWETRHSTRYALAACNPKWHEGVIGIAASKVKEAAFRPAVLIGGGREVLKGSARGVPGFHVFKALERCREYLENFGGHEAAAGLSVRKENVDRFIEEFDRVVSEMMSQCYAPPSLRIDSVLDPHRIHTESLKSLLGLDPFGQGNPSPLVASLNLDIEEISFMGRCHEHLELIVSREGQKSRMLWFGQGQAGRNLALLRKCDVVFTPYSSVFRGEEQVSPLIRDLRRSWSLDSGEFDGVFQGEIWGCGRPVILYTPFEGAAAVLLSSARKKGLTALVHHQQGGCSELEAELVLSRQGGVLVTTAPWMLDRLGTKMRRQRPAVIIVHLPLDEKDLDKLGGWIAEEGLDVYIAKLWQESGSDWVKSTFPEKDQMESVWNYLRKEFPGGRAPLVQLARGWDGLACRIRHFGSLMPSYDLMRSMMEAVIKILEELEMAIYDESRKAPELVLVPKPKAVSLSLSARYREGALVRSAVRSLWDEVGNRVAGYSSGGTGPINIPLRILKVEG